ncbi:hypothetical protein ON010_g1552 [Phytophthora cinnamomi]|nr:hypothetical protein ON010_g1552 [Phytophthora cinnamomi]
MPSEEENLRFEDRMRNARHEHDYYDVPPMPTKRERYSRHAVLVLPYERATEIVSKFSGDNTAAAYLKQFTPHDLVALHTLLRKRNYAVTEWTDAVCHSLVEMKDTELVHFFFEQVADIFCSGSRVDINTSFLILVQGFGWEVIESPFRSCYGCVRDCEALEALVHLARGLPGHNDQNRILESLFNEAKYWDPSCVRDYFEIELLWNCASHCTDITVFDSFVGVLKRLGPDPYGLMIEHLERYSNDVGFSPRERDAFTDRVAARVEYLKLAVVNRGKPGAWSIPEAIVPGEPEVEGFLRGPQQSKEFTCFPDTKAARAFMSKFIDDNCASMFSMECCRDYRSKAG